MKKFKQTLSFLLVAIFIISCTVDEPLQQEEQSPETILKSFEVSTVPNTVNLKWSTEKEIKTINFEVQTSKNAENWTTVTTIIAENQPNQYNYTHEKVNPIIVRFYRLKVENEKEIFYSDVIGITVKGINL